LGFPFYYQHSTKFDVTTALLRLVITEWLKIEQVICVKMADDWLVFNTLENENQYISFILFTFKLYLIWVFWVDVDTVDLPKVECVP